MHTRHILLALLLPLASAAVGAADYLPRDGYEGESLIVIDCLYQPPASAPEARRSGQVLNMYVTVRRDTGSFGGGCDLVHTRFENLTAGTYDVGVQIDYPDRGFQRAGTLVVAPAPAATPAHRGLSGNWFDPAGPGRGLNIVQGVSGALMVVWLDHGSDIFFTTPNTLQEPSWQVVPSGRWVTPTLYRGHLYRAVGSPANHPWNPDAQLSQPSGFVSLRFVSATELVFDVQLPGSLAKPAVTLKRFSF